MVVALVHAIRNGAVIEQRREHVLDRHHHGVDALHVEEGFLLAGKGSVRHVFRRGGGAHRKGGFRFAVGELLVSLMNFTLELGVERRVDHPLADLGTGLGQLCNVVNVSLIQ
ncbi:Uncharacterised protein [Acinetobacter baumannii]|nr:Uncharacterised protein [Acinetobacter baumannii]